MCLDDQVLQCVVIYNRVEIFDGKILMDLMLYVNLVIRQIL